MIQESTMLTRSHIAKLLPPDHLMRQSRCRIYNSKPGYPMIIIPQGEVTTKRIVSHLNPSQRVEVYIQDKDTKVLIPYIRK